MAKAPRRVMTTHVETLPTVHGQQADEAGDDRRKVDRGFDRRRSPRRRVLKGVVVHLRKWPSLQCVVRNVSEGGACLEIRDPLPDSFVLVLDDVPRTCRVVWRQASRVGVEFLK